MQLTIPTKKKEKFNMVLTQQSNLITLARYKFNIYEKRVLYTIVDAFKKDVQGKLNKKLTLFETGALEFYVPASKLGFPEEYNRIRKALKSLCEKVIEIETKESIFGCGLLSAYEFEKNTSVIEITIMKKLYGFLLNMSLGYTSFQFSVAMSLGSIYAMRIYELLAKWRSQEKFYIALEELRKITSTETKFKKIIDFKRYALDIAKRELDKSDITDLRFNYQEKKLGRKIVGFDFWVIKTTNSHELKKNTNELSARWYINKKYLEIFDKIGIVVKGKNIKLIELYVSKFRSCEDFEYNLSKILQYGEKAQETNPNLSIPAYVIGGIKKYLEAPNVPTTKKKKVDNLLGNLGKKKTI